MAVTCALLRLLPVALWILCLCSRPVASQDAVATIEVDGANVTVDNEVCHTAAWRTSSLYATVTPADDIKFESRYAAPYYQQHMKPKVVPNLILLIVFVLLFFFFIFWRWIFCCCQCCCNLCKPSPYPMKYIRDRGMKSTKIFAILMALGVMASGVYGMTQAGKNLVDQTVNTLHLFTGFADKVFGAAYNITTDADLALGIFDDLVVILNVDVNVTGMNNDIACISPWLSNMVNPETIADSLTSLQAELAVFSPARAAAASGLATYNTATTGDWYRLQATNMQLVTGAASRLTDYSSAVADYQTAVSNLPASDPGSSDPRISSIKTTLFTLFELSNSATYTSGFDIAKRLADVTAIYNALSDLSQLHTDSQAAAALPNLHDNLATMQNEALKLYYQNLPGLIVNLNGQYSGYTTVQPCFDTLLYQIDHINETVIALPASMATSYELLSDLDMALELLFTGADTNPQTLATALTTFQATLPPAWLLSVGTSNTTIAELAKYIVYLQPAISGLPNLITDVQTLQTDSGTSTAAYTDSAAAYQAYLSYTSGSATYTAFVNAQTTASSNLNNVKTDLARLNGSPDSTRMSAASTVAQQIVTEQGITALPDPSTLITQVGAMTTSQAAIPDLVPHIVAEAAEGAAYTALPSPKGSVLNAVTSTIRDLDTRFSQTITMVRSDISAYNAQILGKIVTLHNDTVDKVNDKVDEYMPKVRKYDHMRMTGEYVYFSTVVFIALMIIVVVWVNYQWGASFFTFLMLIAMLIYCIIGTVLLLLAVVGHDECGNAETQIFTLIDKVDINSGSFNATLLASYYLQAQGGSLNAIAKNATGVNFVAMQNTINTTIANTIAGITGSYTLRYKMQNEMADIYDLGQLLIADVNAVHELVQFENVHPLYLTTKELACCDVVDVVGNLWLAMFMAGWFAAALMLAMMCYIRRLDELPSKRCCGCAFRSYKEFLEPEDRKLAAIKNKGKYMPAGREGSTPGTPGALSVNAIKVQSNGSLAGGLISGVSGMSNASFDSTQPIKAGVENFNSDGTPRASITPRASSYLAPESARAERSSDSQNRASLLGVKLQPLSVEPSGGSLLSPGSSKKGAARKSFTSKAEEKKDAMKKAMRMNQLG